MLHAPTLTLHAPTLTLHASMLICYTRTSVSLCATYLRGQSKPSSVKSQESVARTCSTSQSGIFTKVNFTSSGIPMMLRFQQRKFGMLGSRLSATCRALCARESASWLALKPTPTTLSHT